MLERDVEQDLKDKVGRLKGAAYKFTSPARRNVPDQLVLLPIPEEHRSIVAKYIRFVELKRPGGRPTGGQHREHERLRALGFTVEVSDGDIYNDCILLEMLK